MSNGFSSICPFGVEAQRLLRLEKGHLIVGQDTDSLTTPREVGLEWAVKMDKPFFIGQRNLQATAKQQINQKLVGFMLDVDFQSTPHRTLALCRETRPPQCPPQECHLIIDRGDIVGRVTSIAFSPTLKQYIGLAYLKPELAEIGNSFSIKLSDGAIVTAIVSRTPFYDPDNTRQREEVIKQEVAV